MTFAIRPFRAASNDEEHPDRNAWSVEREAWRATT